MSLKNQFKTAVLLALLTALFLFIGSLFGKSGFYFALVFVGLMNFGSYWFSSRIVLWMYKAKEAKKSDYHVLYKVVREVSHLSGLPMPKVYIIPTNSPNAFATGRNPKNAVVAATEGILKILNEDELKGVIAHEFGHIRNRDILISTIVGTIAGVLSYVGAMARWSAIFGGFGNRDNDRRGNIISLIILGIITPLIAVLIQLAISRSREYFADETGAKLLKNGKHLADALEKIEKNVDVNPMRFGSTATAHLFISNPFRNASFLSLFMTHPKTAERTKRLREMKF
ncbi:MAG TPA: zinc metalloprotease HtpX [Candidatus Nanoarchaeia archaeon]|nr:zinc metalloprotease HtpX [Candidatus Nanoarchaeia archaeon]